MSENPKSDRPDDASRNRNMRPCDASRPHDRSMKTERRSRRPVAPRTFTAEELAAEYAAYFALPPVVCAPCDPLAARYAADLAFTADGRGTHDGDSLTEGFDVNEGA